METMFVIARTVPRCTRNRARHWPCSSHTKKKAGPDYSEPALSRLTWESQSVT